MSTSDLPYISLHGTKGWLVRVPNMYFYDDNYRTIKDKQKLFTFLKHGGEIKLQLKQKNLETFTALKASNITIEVLAQVMVVKWLVKGNEGLTCPLASLILYVTVGKAMSSILLMSKPCVGMLAGAVRTCTDTAERGKKQLSWQLSNQSRLETTILTVDLFGLTSEIKILFMN